MTTITFEMVFASALRVITKMGPDFVYSPGGNTGCIYVPKTDPRATLFVAQNKGDCGRDECGCMIGEILEDLGLMTDEIASCGGSIAILFKSGWLEATEEAALLMTMIQSSQDFGSTWGEAFLAGVNAVMKERAYR